MNSSFIRLPSQVLKSYSLILYLRLNSLMELHFYLNYLYSYFLILPANRLFLFSKFLHFLFHLLKAHQDYQFRVTFFIFTVEVFQRNYLSQNHPFLKNQLSISFVIFLISNLLPFFQQHRQALVILLIHMLVELLFDRVIP